MLGDAEAIRQRVLNLAEQMYAGDGLYALTLRAIVRQTGISIAEVTRVFPSRQRLIDAMLQRVLVPVSEERRNLLRQMQARIPLAMKPIHVIVCLVLPLIRDFANERSPHQAAFLMRAAHDMDPVIRDFFARHFHDECEAFGQAFADSAAGHVETLTRWKAEMFVNTLPGTTINGSFITMCHQCLSDPHADCFEALFNLGMLAHGALLGHADEREVRGMVRDSLDILGDSATLHALRQLLARGI